MSEHTAVKFNSPEKVKKPTERSPYLVVMEGPLVGKVFPINKSPLMIGRGEGVDISFTEDGVSRKHVKIENNNGVCTLTDLGSTNGTHVNGIPTVSVDLQDGDKILVGEVLLRFSYQDSMDVEYQKHLRKLSIRDALTQIYNRHYFDDTLGREFNYAIRLNQPLSCIMFDVDHFKAVNDKYGHAAGDKVLQAIAKNILEKLRKYDVFARYGGEEFIILLRAVNLDNATLLAERIRKQVENLDILSDGLHLSVTISIGVATLDPVTSGTPDALVKEADQYLYEAKRSGRNRVCSKVNPRS